MHKSIKHSTKIITAFIVLSSMYSCNKNDETDTSYNDIELEVLQLVNQYRIINSFEPLKMHKTIYLEASTHTNYMIRQNAISHDNFQDRTSNLKQEINANAFAENVAYGQKSAQEVVTAWLNSDGHKKNIEGNYNYTGIRAKRNESGQLYFTQIFARLP